MDLDIREPTPLTVRVVEQLRARIGAMAGYTGKLVVIISFTPDCFKDIPDFAVAKRVGITG